MSAPVVGVGSGIPAAPEHPVEYRRVYVWELPVRAYHWINAVALVLLCVTGYLIGAPIGGVYASEAYQQYWFGWVRFIHFRVGVCVRVQLCGPAVLGICGQQVRQVEQLLPAEEIAAAGDCGRDQDRRAADQAAWAHLDGPQFAGGIYLLLHVSGVCRTIHHRVSRFTPA